MNSGFHRAIVRENADPEKLGRIKVEYPWFQGDSSERPSEWVEVCVPYASQDAGFWFLPEKGDEVLVYLENGSLDHPIILGALYSKKHPTPKTGRAGDGNANDKNDLKAIITRSGHTLCFDDSSADRGIVLKDKEGRRFEIQSQKDTITFGDTAGNEIRIAEAVITLKNKAGDQIVMDGGTLRIKSQSVKIEAAGAVEIGAGASEALVKGQSFMSLFNSHTHVAPLGPTSPPVVPMTPAQLSMTVKTA